MTDSHAHLMMSPIIEDLNRILQDFTSKGGKHIVNATYDIESIIQAIKIHIDNKALYGDLIYTAFGIHPELFCSCNDFKKQITDFDDAKKITDEFKKIFKENKNIVTFIGEIGLDYHIFSRFDDKTLTADHIEKSKEIQRLVFRELLEIAVKNNLPATIHCRDKADSTDAIKDALKIICEVGKGSVKGCMHSYTGSKEYIKEIVDLGLYIGFNQIITYKNAENVRELVRLTPIDRILLETDSPLLPLRLKNSPKYGMPSDIIEVARVVGEIKNIQTQSVLQNSTSFISYLLR